VTSPEKLVLRKADTVDLIDLSFDLNRIHAATEVFDLPIPKPWQNQLKEVGDAIGTLRHFDLAQEADFQYLASGFQGLSEVSYLTNARKLHTMGLPKPAVVIEAYCALARNTDLDPEALEYNEEEDIDDEVREQLQTLRTQWIDAIHDVQPEILMDYLTKEVPVRFLPDAEFNSYWVGQISASARFKALPKEALRNQRAVRWHTHEEAKKALANHKIEISYTIWVENNADQQTTSHVVASNRGLLRILGNNRTNLHRLVSWPEGKFILDFPPQKKLESKGPVDMYTRLEYNGIDRKLTKAHKTAPKWPLGETRFVLANLRDVMRREYLSATLGVSNKTLFAPFVYIVMWSAVVAILVLYGDLYGDVARFVNSDRSLPLLLALTVKVIFLPWALVEIYWRTLHFGSLLRGTIVRGRGKSPMHDSFGGTSFGHSNIILRLIGHRQGQ